MNDFLFEHFSFIKNGKKSGEMDNKMKNFLIRFSQLTSSFLLYHPQETYIDNFFYTFMLFYFSLTHQKVVNIVQ